MTMGTKTRQRAAKILLALALRLAGTSVHAQENRKALNNPTPTYPETARQFRLTGVVKVQIVIAPDSQIKDVKVLGGHPLLELLQLRSGATAARSPDRLASD